MKPHACLPDNARLEEAARRAEERKHEAIDRLTRKLAIALETDDETDETTSERREQ